MENYLFLTIVLTRVLTTNRDKYILTRVNYFKLKTRSYVENKKGFKSWLFVDDAAMQLVPGGINDDYRLQGGQLQRG